MEVVSAKRSDLEPDPVLLVSLEVEIVKVDLGLTDDLHEGALLVHDEDRGKATLTPESGETLDDRARVLCLNHLEVVDQLADGVTEHHDVFLGSEALPESRLALVPGDQSMVRPVQVQVGHISGSGHAELVITDWTHNSTLDTHSPDDSEEASFLEDVTVGEGDPVASLGPGVLGNVQVDVHGDGEGDGGVPLDEGSEEVKPDLGPDAVSGELGGLEQTLAVNDAGATHPP